MSDAFHASLPRFDSGEAPLPSQLIRSLIGHDLAGGEGCAPPQNFPVRPKPPGPWTPHNWLKSETDPEQALEWSVDGSENEPDEGTVTASTADPEPDTELDLATDLMPPQAPEPEPAPRIDLAELEALVASLSKQLEVLKRETAARAARDAREIVAALLPELSKAFLAEEVGRHLPAIVPASAPAVKIAAQPELAAQLMEIVARHPELDSRCVFIPAGSPKDTRVNVSWETGGATFDFDSLLASCLTQLDASRQPLTKE